MSQSTRSLHEVLEHRRVELVVDLLALPFGDHEAGGPEHSQMAGDGRPARMETLRDFAGRLRSRAERFENGAGGRRRQATQFRARSRSEVFCAATGVFQRVALGKVRTQRLPFVIARALEHLPQTGGLLRRTVFQQMNERQR